MFRPFNKPEGLLFKVALIVAFCHSPAVFSQDFDDLLRFVPGDANALILLDAAALNATESKDAKAVEDQFAVHSQHLPVALPRAMKYMVLAAEFDLATLDPQWEMAVASFEDDDLVEHAANKSYSEIEPILDKACCVIDDIQFVQLDRTMVGLMWPANRQKIARWIRETQGRDSSALSNYLERVVAESKKKDHAIVLAVDLTDVVSAETMRKSIERSPTVKRYKADVGKLTQLFSGVRGIRLEVQIDKEQNAANTAGLTLDFSGDTASIAEFAKPMLLELLRNAGAMLPDFTSWRASADGTQVTISGPLSDAGLRQLGSLLVLDASTLERKHKSDRSIVGSNKTRELDQKTIRRESRSYLRDIERLVQDLQTGRRSPDHTVSVEQYALFLDRYARRIHRMPVRRVDYEVAKTGRQVGDHLNQVVEAIKDASNNFAKARAEHGSESISMGAIPYQQITTPWERYYYYAPYYFWNIDLTKLSRLENEMLEQLEATANDNFEEIGQLLEQAKTQLEEQYPSSGDK